MAARLGGLVYLELDARRAQFLPALVEVTAKAPRQYDIPRD
jgi:hypothetical protein